MTITNQLPTANQYNQLRVRIGWGAVSKKIAINSLKNSLFLVSAFHDQRLQAMGRIVGDGQLYFYLQDVMVDPGAQGRGLGSSIMQELEYWLDVNAPSGATIGLLTALGKEPFYQKFGYQIRDGVTLGQGMCRFV